MIFIGGFILYALAIFGAVYVDAIHIMVNQALLLAPELTISMLSLYFYPAILSSLLFLTRKRSVKHGSLIRNQTNISASVAVSLGLIGTFQGLTMMVTSIASSMSGDGDLAEKMGIMIAAIADALSAMSYAFLTSIFGVTISVLLILSLNFWMFGFKEKSEESHTDALLTNIAKRLAQIAKSAEETNEYLQRNTESSSLDPDDNIAKLVSALQEINKEPLSSKATDDMQHNLDQQAAANIDSMSHDLAKERARLKNILQVITQ